MKVLTSEVSVSQPKYHMFVLVQMVFAEFLVKHCTIRSTNHLLCTYVRGKTHVTGKENYLQSKLLLEITNAGILHAY